MTKGSVPRGMARIIRILAFLGCVVMAVMAVVVTVNVAGRFFFGHPLKGTVELVEAMMLIVAFFAIPYTAQKRGHVRVTLIVSRFPKPVQLVVRRVGFFISAFIIGTITYQATVNTIYYIRHLNETTPILYIPLAPFRLIMALGCLVLCVHLLLDMWMPDGGGEGREADIGT